MVDEDYSVPEYKNEFMSVEFHLPFFVTLPRKTKEDRKVMLNLNIYRNLHHHVLDEIKKRFEPISFPGGEHRVWDHAVIRYAVYKSGKRKYDTMNIISVVDKFFCDWLVNNKWLNDDDCDSVLVQQVSGRRECPENIILASVLFRGKK